MGTKYGNKNAQLSPEEEAKRQKVAKKPLTAKECASLCGIEVSTWYNWLRSRGLRCNNIYLSPEEHEQRTKAYNATDNDYKAAKLCYLSPQGFRLWRIKQGLPNKRNKSTLLLSEGRQEIETH